MLAPLFLGKLIGRLVSLLVIVTVAGGFAGLVQAADTGKGKGEKPNVVLILVDDMGWRDLGCYGNNWIETPAIDGLASQGVRFTDFYANGAVCSPTRAGLQSGQYQSRFALTAHIPGHFRPFEKVTEPPNAYFMPEEIVTVGEAMQAAGYHTGYFGKWHLGSRPEHMPPAQGYDEVITVGGSHFYPGFRTAPKVEIGEGAYQSEFLSGRVLDYMERQAGKDTPFFVTMALYEVHIPLQARREKIDKYQKKPRPDGAITHPVYAAMVEHVDDSVGQVLQKLDDLGLSEDTLVIFTSDNGGLYTRYDGQGYVVTSNAPLRSEKGAPYEGGVRIPTIIRWPGVTQAGQTCGVPAMSMDFYPTLLEAAGIPAPEGYLLDGKSLMPLLKDPAKGSLDREAIYWHYPHYHHSRPSSSLRAGDYKLIHFYDSGQDELYNLKDDIGETVDLAAQQSGRTKELRAKLDAWIDETGSYRPYWNEKFDPVRATEWWNKRTLEPIDLEATREQIRSLPFDGPKPR